AGGLAAVGAAPRPSPAPPSRSRAGWGGGVSAPPPLPEAGAPPARHHPQEGGEQAGDRRPVPGPAPDPFRRPYRPRPDRRAFQEGTQVFGEFAAAAVALRRFLS